MIKTRINNLWGIYGKLVTIFSIVSMVYVGAYSTDILYTTVPKYILNIGILLCVVIQCIYFEEITFKIKWWIKIFFGLSTLYTVITVESFLVKDIGILILLYLCLANKSRIIKKIGIPLSILSCVVVGFQVSNFLSIRWKEPIAIQYLIKLILNCININAEITDKSLNVNLNGKVISYFITNDILMIYTFGVVFIIVWIFLVEKNLKNFVKLFLGFLMILLVRFIVSLTLYSYTENLKVFWGIGENYWICIVITIFAIFATKKEEKKRDAIFYMNSETFAFYSFALLFLFMLILGFEYGSIGKEKQGRILIDEWHSEGWESVEEALNTTEYLGQKSVYTYTSMIELLEKLYSVTIKKSEDVLSSLENYDILIIKTPTKAFSKEEIEKVQVFMENGGGVFFIGDHTNLFNMNKYINDITQKYGIELNYDAIYDIRDGNFVNLCNNKFMQTKSIAAIEQYKFATSCSIKPDLLTRIEMSIVNGCAEDMDISQINFFGNMIPEPSEKLGTMCVAASKEIGRGRMFVFSDSTTLSSFSIFMHDNPEFLIGVMEYLNCENVINVYYIFGTIILIGIFVIYIKKRKNILFNIGLISMVGIFLLGGIGLYTIFMNEKNEKAVDNKLDSIESIYFLDDDKLSHFIGYDILEENYQNVFLDIQRHGKMLREKKEIDDCIKENSEAIFITNIDRSLSKREKSELEKYVSKGGKLVLLDSQNRSKDSMDDILHIFGIFKTNQTILEDVVIKEKIKLEYMHTYYYANQSSILEKVINSDYPANFNMNIFKYKSGTIFVINDAYYLSNDFMGDPGMPSTKQQYDLHQALHKLINEIIY